LFSSLISLWSAIWFAGGVQTSSSDANLLLIALWTIHYIHRALIFPFQTVDRGQKMPFLVVGAAIVFNFCNASLNGYYLATMVVQNNVRVVVGVLIMLLGALLNIDHDYYLISLRKSSTAAPRGKSKSHYVVPEFGLFRLVSCANLFSEVVEWIGFAIAAYPSLPAMSFALWTFFNLAPRAIAHHRWYQETFSDYPPNRRAIIPFLL
jgi:3-oxo-5-alpha-steroid 4-dehydrogenase 1